MPAEAWRSGLFSYTRNHMNTKTTSLPTSGKTAHFTREDRLAEARSILERGLEDVEQDPEALARYLRFRAHFRQYSPQNTLLIQAQRPTARYVKGFAAWKDVGRHVRKGEKGIMILAPVLRRPTEEEARKQNLDPQKDHIVAAFRVAYVWDITQTEVIPGYEETALRYESPIPKLRGDDFAHLYVNLTRVAERLGFQVIRYDDRLEEGYCDFRRRMIGVRVGSDNDATLTLAHELAHAVAHEKTEGLSYVAAELQAEGAAFVLCYALGLDARMSSLQYLKAYEERGTAIAEQLDAIDRIAFWLLRSVQDLLDENHCK